MQSTINNFLATVSGATSAVAGYLTPIYTTFSTDPFGASVDFTIGTLDGLLHTVIPPVPYFGDIVPHFESYYGHADVFALGSGVGTVTGVVASFAVGNIASGASGLVACGSLAQRAAQLYTTASTVLGVAGAAVNIAQTGTVGVGDALALAPAIGFGLGKLSAATYCFFAGTPVATEFGQKPIESVRAGERVWSCDLTTGEWKLCRVAETYVNDHVGDLIAVFVAGSRIESMYHHPYWVIEGRNLDDRPTPDHVADAFVPNSLVPGRWVDAGDLQIGDVLLLKDSRRVPIGQILVRQVEDKVYNFAVDGLHNYAVGADCVLVHNNCYDVGLAKNLRNTATEFTQVNHVPQSREAELLIGGLSRTNKFGNEVAIRLSISEHAAVTAAQAQRGALASARDLLASDIRILRNHTGAPNSALQRLIDLSEALHPYDFLPL